MPKRKSKLTVFLHVFDARGELQYQASLLEPERGGCWVLLYCLLTGEPTREHWLSNEELHNPRKCRFYVDHEIWLAAFKEYTRASS